MLTPSSPAPMDISITDEQEQMFTLRDLLGSWVIVYFYPRDNTPGCTVEAEGFRDLQASFAKEGARILGVSKDTCASHRKFIEKKELTYTLIADTDHALMEAFGTWGTRTFMGRSYQGTSRSTFLINPSGTIAHVWESVKPLGHAKEVLTMLRMLKKERSK